MRFESSLRCVALLSVVACSKGSSRTNTDTARTNTETARGNTVTAHVPERVTAQTPTPTQAAAARDTCPATGLWAVCSVVYRLDRTGLIPVLDSNAVAREPKLTQSGKKIAIGSRAELAIYVYPDKKSREADEAHLDKSQFLGADDAKTMDAKRTLIDNENLLAIFTSRDDHQRERVANALESGPPQPAKP